MNSFFYPDDSEILKNLNRNSSFKYFRIVRIEKKCSFIFWGRSYDLTVLLRDLWPLVYLVFILFFYVKGITWNSEKNTLSCYYYYKAGISMAVVLLKLRNIKSYHFQKIQSMSPHLGSYVSRFREQTKEMFRQGCVILPDRRGRFTCQICKQNK